MAYQVIIKWQQRGGSKATAETLISALRDNGYIHLADELDGK